MSEGLVEHPILFIENLLKLGLGEEGRLLYLKKALTMGKNIHNSDKKFLKKMQYALNDVQGLKSEKPSGYFTSQNFKENNLEIQKIQNQIVELKQGDSKLKENLEFLLICHEDSYSQTINKSKSFSNLLKDKKSRFLETFKKNFKSRKF